MHPNEPDWKKDLAEGPVSGRGFDEKLRRRIEAELDRQEAKRRKRMWLLWPSLVSGCLLMAGTALFAFDWVPSGGGELALHSRTVAAAGSSGLVPVSEGEALASLAVSTEEERPIRSGVLIGFRIDGTSDVAGSALPVDETEGLSAAYRTLMIAPEDGSVRVTAEGPGILVPFGQKFWRLDPVVLPAADGRLTERITARPADTQADGSAARKLVASKEGTMFASSSSAAGNGISTVVVHREQLVFAGNQYVSVRETDWSGSGSEPVLRNRYLVHKLTQLPSPSSDSASVLEADLSDGVVTLPDVYGEGAADTLKQLFASRNQGAYALDDWTIVRKPGRWVAQVDLAAGGAAVGSDEARVEAVPQVIGDKRVHAIEAGRLADFPLPLPEQVTAHDTVYATLGQIRSLQPNATDALASPLQDLLLVLTDRQLVVYKGLGQGKDAVPLLKVPLMAGEQLVSAQWATGSYVPAWIEKTRKYLNE